VDKEPILSRPAENLRVRRTRILLRRALLELIEDRGFDRVTVGQICERAMVSRAAFYRHYRDKYHLVEEVFDEATAALTDGMHDGGGSSPVPRLQRFFDHIADHELLYQALLGPKGSSWFTARIQNTLTAMTSGHLRLAAPLDDLVATLLGGMLTNAITWWLHHQRPLNSHDLATKSAELADALVARAQTLSNATTFPVTGPESPRSPGCVVDERP
jgi:AcrR family transcriptional regulator